MKKGIILTAFALALASVGAVQALTDRQFKIPVDANGNKASEVEQYGVSVASDSVGTPQDNQGPSARTTGKLFASGPGVLYDLVVGSTTTSGNTGEDWVACIDASAAEDFQSTDLDIVLLALVSRKADVEASMAEISPTPVEFKLGLVCDTDTDFWYFPKYIAQDNDGT